MSNALSHTGSMVKIDQELDHVAKLQNLYLQNKVKHNKTYCILFDIVHSFSNGFNLLNWA